MSARPQFDIEQAWREGWTLSQRSDAPPYAIETLDDPESVGSTAEGFTDDGAAMVHVALAAAAGSAYHQAALDFLREHSPEAYDWVLSWVPTPSPKTVRSAA